MAAGEIPAAFFLIKFWRCKNNPYFCTPQKTKANEKNISTIKKKARE